MCGICGFVGAGSPDDLTRMNDALAHRGPDAGDTWRDAGRAVHLGHRRLSIIDLTDGGQPMHTADGRFTVVFNGEIYNHLELRHELIRLGHRFQTDHSDTEVLLHGYHEWGTDLVRRLNGMWAFALYDAQRGQVFCSRDRFGKKPFFYCHKPGFFAFASELRALALHPEVGTTVSRLALKKFFAYGYIPGPHSYYEEVRKLPGGYNLLLDMADMRIETTRYWRFEIDPFDTMPANPEEEWGGRIRELLSRSVERRLMADVPLGIFLSGGVDSSSVTAYAVRHAGGERVRTFSIGFDEDSFDESRHAERAARHYATDHNLARLSVSGSRALLPEIAAGLDEPMGDSSLLPTYLLSRETRRKVTVALGGDGADELFAGYDPFRALKWARMYDSLVPRPVHRGITLAAAHLPTGHRNMSIDFKIRRTLRGLDHPRPLWNPVWLGPLAPADLDDLFREPTDIEEVYEEALLAWEECGQDDLVDKTLQFYTNLYLQDDILVKVDRASMMHGLEVRTPYLDIDLVDFVRRIPGPYKFRNGTTKYLLKKALEPVVPGDILHRSKKGFGVPIGKWFMEGSLDCGGAPLGDILHAPAVQRREAAHRAGRVDERAFLWNIWLLGAWSGACPAPAGLLDDAEDPA